MYIYIKVKFATVAEGDPKANITLTILTKCSGGRYSFPWVAQLYLLILSVKGSGIKYHFLCLWYDAILD